MSADFANPEPPTPAHGERRQNFLRRLAPMVLIAMGLAVFFASGLHRYFTLDALRENRAALKSWVDAAPFLAAATFILAYACAVAISFPGATILTVFGGFLFGLWPGVPAVVFAATLGATIVFLAARTAFGDFLNRRVKSFSKRMKEGFREGELNYMFILRLAPVFPFWAVNIAAGVLGVRLRNFVIGTFFGIIPGAFVYAGIGAAAGAAFDAGETVSLRGVLLTPETLLPIIGLVVLALVPLVLQRFGKKAARLREPEK
jgi:uncharacterized membrane protein YdjX (TVP38/TMEM64 family)